MSSSINSTKEYSKLINELKRGGVCVFPTDTVVGIGCLAFCGKDRIANLAGVNKIFEIKHRDVSQKLPWLVGGYNDVERYASGELSLAYKIAEEHWPGDVTIVVPASSCVDSKFCMEHNSVNTLAMRCPNVDFLLTAIKELGSPIVCTSANVSGEPAVAAVEEVSPKVLEFVDLIFTGEGCALSSTGAASNIFDCCGKEIVRLR